MPTVFWCPLCRVPNNTRHPRFLPLLIPTPPKSAKRGHHCFLHNLEYNPRAVYTPLYHPIQQVFLLAIQSLFASHNNLSFSGRLGSY
eukprot:UN07182